VVGCAKSTDGHTPKRAALIGSIIGDGPPRTSVLLIHDQIGRGEIGEWDDPAAYPLFLGGSRVRPPDLRLSRAVAWRMTAGLAQRGGARHRCRTRRPGTAAAPPTSTCSPRLTARGRIPRFPRLVLFVGFLGQADRSLAAAADRFRSAFAE
jgi:hypothetical protein